MLAAVSRPDVFAALELVWRTYLADHTVFVCGNGGSAATASHFACDLGKLTITDGRRRLRAIALTDNLPIISAWANDSSFEDAFLQPLAGLCRPGDLLVAISASGNSANVLRAIDWAHAHGLHTLGLSGFDGGPLASLADVNVTIDRVDLPQIEDGHSVLCHALAVGLAAMIRKSGPAEERGPAESRSRR